MTRPVLVKLNQHVSATKLACVLLCVDLGIKLHTMR